MIHQLTFALIIQDRAVVFGVIYASQIFHQDVQHISVWRHDVVDSMIVVAGFYESHEAAVDKHLQK